MSDAVRFIVRTAVAVLLWLCALAMLDVPVSLPVLRHVGGAFLAMLAVHVSGAA